METLSQQRKVQKRLKKSLKKQDKEQLKAQKEEEHLRRQVLAAEVAAARQKDAAARGETLPIRTRSTKSIATQMVKSLSLKSPLSKLTRHVRRDKSEPPTLDDFDSKSAIREYLNPSPPPPAALTSSSAEIAELPAALPQYTPFQDLTRTQDNEPIALLEDAAAAAKEKDPASSPVEAANLEPTTSQPKARSMRCDSCQSPIRLNQIYYHCSICDDGDRILCCSCDQAGWSCRHELTEKVRIVSRPQSSDKANVSTLIRERSRSEVRQYAATMLGLDGSNAAAPSTQWSESPVDATISAASPWAYNDIEEKPSPARGFSRNSRAASQDARELDYQQRKQDLAFKEKEITLREREAKVREQQVSIREQEATLHLQKQMFSMQLQAAITRQMADLSEGVGAQFQDLSQVGDRPTPTAFHHMVNSPGGSSTNDELQNDHIRTHATKRKAGAGKATVSPADSTGSPRKSSLKRTPSGDRDRDGRRGRCCRRHP